MQPQPARKIGYSKLAVFGNSQVTEAMYKAIASAASDVPIAGVLKRLSLDQRGDLLARLTGAILDGLLDDANLSFLTEGEWIAFDGAFLSQRRVAYGDDIIEADYVSNACVRFDKLLAWAVDENIPTILPWGLWYRGLSVGVNEQSAAGIRYALDKLRAATAGTRQSISKTRSEISASAPDLNASPDANSFSKRAPKRKFQASCLKTNKGGRPANLDRDAFKTEAERMVAAGEQASIDDRGQTQEAFVEALQSWGDANMEKNYSFETVKKYVKKNWSRWRLVEAQTS